VRHFWRGDPGHVGDVASRLAGSADIYKWSDRGAYASINFVVAHDGYTLHDLVSYEQKHNEANGENNRDGHNDNISRNWSVEGETDNPEILDIRFRSMKNVLATLAFSQGVPMISHGDEIARTQRGNNNAYAQDNETTWVNWDLDERREELLDFARKVFAIRRLHPVLRRRHFFQGQPIDASGQKDVTWLRADGSEMRQEDWTNPATLTLGMLIHGDATDEVDERGRPVKGDTLLIVISNAPADVDFRLPRIEQRGLWAVLVDTNRRADEPAQAVKSECIRLVPHSLVLLRYGRERRLAIERPSRAESVAHGAKEEVQ
jgi:isoamylase